jgi:Icc-related predicted phosphoesterase
MNLCIDAQIHEVNKRELIGKTVTYNPGMFRDGGWLEMHINKSEIKTILHEQP